MSTLHRWAKFQAETVPSVLFLYLHPTRYNRSSVYAEHPTSQKLNTVLAMETLISEYLRFALFLHKYKSIVVDLQEKIIIINSFPIRKKNHKWYYFPIIYFIVIVIWIKNWATKRKAVMNQVYMYIYIYTIRAVEQWLTCF